MTLSQALSLIISLGGLVVSILTYLEKRKRRRKRK